MGSPVEYFFYSFDNVKILGGMPMPTFMIAGFGLAGFIAGVISIIKKDRAVLVFLSILVGLVIMLWIAAELIFPH
jgi:hypothetical protein